MDVAVVWRCMGSQSMSQANYWPEKYYDKEGKEIDWAQFCLYKEASMQEDGYKRVGSTTLPNGMWVSTVWTGHDVQYGDGPPLMFESEVFGSFDNLADSRDKRGYSSLELAEKGHQELIGKWSNEPNPEPEEED